MATILADNPSKAAEIAHLSEFLKTLPANSYLSGILTELAPEIGRAITSDLGFIDRDYRAAAAELIELNKKLTAARAELGETIAMIKDNRRIIGRLCRELGELDSAARSAARDTAQAAGRAATIAAANNV